MSDTMKPPKRAAADAGLSAEERAAVRERAREAKAAARGASRAEGERDVREKIAELPEPERSLAERLHGLVTAVAPDLAPRTYYGMPAYARNGKVLCFYQPAARFKTRYGTVGFTEEARLDDGAMWPTSFAVMELTPDVESALTALVKQAVG